MNILIPVDGTELSLHVTRFALRLAQEGLKTRIILANAQEPASLYERLTSHDDARMLADMTQETGEDMIESARRLVNNAGLVHESVVITGDPATSIIELAQIHACDLIVMGTRALGALRSAIEGSVSRSVVEGATVPVLIVKAPDPIRDEA